LGQPEESSLSIHQRQCCLPAQPPYHRVVTRLPGLPFPDAAFDAIAASFVISHLASCADGLADMVRICKPGGRVGVTAWGTQPNPVGALWTRVAMTIEVE
jgi:ubiquinone/menaquinone biosynthesis C-methylase UbiE